jgi:hypothetical protein
VVPRWITLSAGLNNVDSKASTTKGDTDLINRIGYFMLHVNGEHGRGSMNIGGIKYEKLRRKRELICVIEI